MGSMISISIELDAIKYFLDKTLNSIDKEVKIILKEESKGKYTEIDDLPNALFLPLEQEKIALRAAYYELNALIEWELQQIANKAYHNSSKYNKYPKSFADISSEAEIPKIKLIYDLLFNDVCKLVEEYYGIKISDLPGFEKIQIVRQSVNAFKHRGGFKDFRKNKVLNLTNRFEISRDDAYDAIEKTKLFIRQLQTLTQRLHGGKKFLDFRE